MDMPNVCNIPNCKGNYKSTGPCKIFRLPKDNHEMKKWLNVLPLKSAEVNVKTFRIATNIGQTMHQWSDLQASGKMYC